jgi:GH43 family beta-xylosidase
MRIRPLRAALITLLMLAPAYVTVAFNPLSSDAAVGFTNPVASAPYAADPWVGYDNGYYYLAATTWNNQVVIKRAKSVAALPAATESVVHTGTASASCCNVWAPELHKLSGPNGTRWYLYYTAGTAACCEGQRSFVLESAGTDPMGPYTFKGQLNVQANNGWAIDGSVATIGGKNYFLYSSWVGDLQSLFIAPMSNPWTVSALGTRISYPTHAWEQVGTKVNEAPYVLQRDGKTFLTYSASSCNTPDYKIGMLTLTGGNPLAASSWTKKSTPIFQRSDANSVYGPGHHSFFTSPDGSETWMAYHANETTAQGCGATRTTRLKKVNFNSDGTPHLGTPDKLATTLTAPSGDPGGTVTFPAAGTSYRLTNTASGKVLDARNCSAADGTVIQQWTSLGNTCQQWTFTRTTSNYYRITNVNSGKVLDSVNCGTANGTGVDLWSSLGNACQEWSLTPVGGGYLIANRGNGLVLDVTDCGTADGVAIRQWASLGNTCQKWKIAA